MSRRMKKRIGTGEKGNTNYNKIDTEEENENTNYNKNEKEIEDA